MSIRELCQTEVVSVTGEVSVGEVARLMRENHVGDVVVCAREGGRPRPIGILTDRDIVIGLLAMDIPPSTVKVEDVMTPTLLTVDADAGVHQTIMLMEKHGIRRLPVVDREGTLMGIISSADLLALLGEEIMAISRLAERQRIREREMRV